MSLCNCPTIEFNLMKVVRNRERQSNWEFVVVSSTKNDFQKWNFQFENCRPRFPVRCPCNCLDTVAAAGCCVGKEGKQKIFQCNLIGLEFMLIRVLLNVWISFDFAATAYFLLEYTIIEWLTYFNVGIGFKIVTLIVGY